MLSFSGRRIPKSNSTVATSKTTATSTKSRSILPKTISSSSATSAQQLLFSSIFLHHEFPSSHGNNIQNQLTELYYHDKRDFFARALPKNWLMFSALVVDRLFPGNSTKNNNKFDFTKQLFLSRFTNPESFGELFQISKRIITTKEKEEIPKNEDTASNFFLLEELDGLQTKDSKIEKERKQEQTFSEFLTTLVPVMAKKSVTDQEKNSSISDHHDTEISGNNQVIDDDHSQFGIKQNNSTPIDEFLRIAPPKFWKARVLYEMNSKVGIHRKRPGIDQKHDDEDEIPELDIFDEGVSDEHFNKNRNNNNGRRSSKNIDQHDADDDDDDRIMVISTLQKIFLDGVLSHPFWEGHGQENFEKVHAATVECLAATAKFYAFHHMNNNNNNNQGKKYVQIPIGESPITTTFVRKARHLYENIARPDLFISLLEIAAVVCFRDLPSLTSENNSPSLIIQDASDIRNITLISSRMLNLHPDLTPYFITSASKRSAHNNTQDGDNSRANISSSSSTFLSSSTQEKFDWAKRGFVLALSLMAPRRLMEEKQRKTTTITTTTTTSNINNHHHHYSKNSLVTREWDLCLKCISNVAVFTGRDDDEATKNWLKETREKLSIPSSIDDATNKINYYPNFFAQHQQDVDQELVMNSYSCFSVRLVDILDTALSVWRTAHGKTNDNNTNLSKFDASTQLHLTSIANVAQISVLSILKHFEDSLETRLKVIGFHSSAVNSSVPLALNLLMKQQQNKEKIGLNGFKSGVEIILHSNDNNDKEANNLLSFLHRNLDAALESAQPMASVYNILDTFASFWIESARQQHHNKNKINNENDASLRSCLILTLLGNEQIFKKLDFAFKNEFSNHKNETRKQMNNNNNNRKNKTSATARKHHPMTILLIQKFGFITPLPPDDFSEIDFLTSYLFSASSESKNDANENDINNNNSGHNTAAAVKVLLNQLQKEMSSSQSTATTSPSIRKQVNEVARKIFASLMLKTYDGIFSNHHKKLSWRCAGCNGTVFWPARFCLNCTFSNSASSVSGLGTCSFTCPNCKHSSDLFSSSSPSINTTRCNNCLTLHPASECFMDYQRNSNNNNDNNTKSHGISDIFSLYPQSSWECNSCTSPNVGVGQICVPVITTQNSENNIAEDNNDNVDASGSTSTSCCSGCPQCKTENPNQLVSCKHCGTLNRSDEDVTCKNGCGDILNQSKKLSIYLNENKNVSSILPPLLLWNCPCCATLKVITSSTSQKETKCTSCGYSGKLFSNDENRNNNTLVLPYQQWRCGCRQFNSPTHYHCISCSAESSTSQNQEQQEGKRYTCSSCNNKVSCSSSSPFPSSSSSSSSSVPNSSSTVPILVGDKTFQQNIQNSCSSCHASHPIDVLKLKKPVWTLCADCDTILPTTSSTNSDASLRCPSSSQKLIHHLHRQQQQSDEKVKEHEEVSFGSSARKLRISFSACPWSCHKCGDVNDIFSVLAEQNIHDNNKNNTHITASTNSSNNNVITITKPIQVGPAGALLCKNCGTDRLPVSLFSETERWNCNHCGASNNNSGFICCRCHELHPHVGSSAVYSWVCGGNSTASQSKTESTCNTINPSWLKHCAKCGSENRKVIVMKNNQDGSSPSTVEEIQLKYLPWHIDAATNDGPNQKLRTPSAPPLCALCLQHHASLKCSKEHQTKRLNALEEQLLSFGEETIDNVELLKDTGFVLLPDFAIQNGNYNGDENHHGGTKRKGRLPFPLLDQKLLPSSEIHQGLTTAEANDHHKIATASFLESVLSGGLF